MLFQLALSSPLQDFSCFWTRSVFLCIITTVCLWLQLTVNFFSCIYTNVVLHGDKTCHREKQFMNSLAQIMNIQIRLRYTQTSVRQKTKYIIAEHVIELISILPNYFIFNNSYSFQMHSMHDLFFVFLYNKCHFLPL